MDNKEIAKILYEISEYLAMEDVPFKPRAYEKAALSIESQDINIAEIYKNGGIKALEEIPSVGKGIAEKIEELIKTGKIREYEKLKKKAPVKIEELSAVEGMGPKRIFRLYKELNIRNVKDLEIAAKSGKIGKLEGFGEKSEQNILLAIGFLKSASARFPLGYVLCDIRHIKENIEKQKGVKKCLLAGSMRRMKETVGDADILVSVASQKVADEIMDYFVTMPEVAHVQSHGPTRSSVKFKNNMNCDLRVVDEESFGAAAQYFTGNKDHNVALRKIAIKKNWKLNEYGIYSGGKQLAGKNEEDIYKLLGLQYIEPELRENTGEIDLAVKNQLPKIIGYNDLKGDLQVHSKWSDGQNSIEEMAKAAKDIGLEYIAITDHIRKAFGSKLEEKELALRLKEIEKAKKTTGMEILNGGEVDIMNDGSLYMKDEVLKKLDFVGASVHSNFKMPKNKMTERIIKAMKNPNVDIIYHPTGRIIGQRPAYEVDMGKIIRAAKETKTVLEINSYFNRLDLNDEHIKSAIEAGVKMAINTDAHQANQFKYLELGIAQARRGWAEKKDIINAWPAEKMLKMLK